MGRTEARAVTLALQNQIIAITFCIMHDHLSVEELTTITRLRLRSPSTLLPMVANADMQSSLVTFLFMTNSVAASSTSTQPFHRVAFIALVGLSSPCLIPLKICCRWQPLSAVSQTVQPCDNCRVTGLSRIMLWQAHNSPSQNYLTVRGRAFTGFWNVYEKPTSMLTQWCGQC